MELKYLRKKRFLISGLVLSKSEMQCNFVHIIHNNKQIYTVPIHTCTLYIVQYMHTSKDGRHFMLLSSSTITLMLFSIQFLL